MCVQGEQIRIARVLAAGANTRQGTHRALVAKWRLNNTEVLRSLFGVP